VFEKLKTHKTANWLANDSVKHSFTYVPDAGNATAVLGNTPTAYNQIWHLPTDKDALTGKEFIEKVAACYNANPKYTVLKSWMMKAAGLFNPLAKESVEMLYQYEYEYLFDSTKFEKAFFQPTSYQTGIEAEAKW
ncbi:MAG: NAD-dependent dehydratase, partial [Ignavibacteria bacterium]|nr:NAD-dependent dehydratase [Ignavibacteria bacterium]